MRFALAPILMLLALFPAGAAAQDTTGTAGRAGRRPLLPLATEVALARSAAPSSISGNARVLVLSDTGFVVALEGSTGVTCVVNRSWPQSLEPHCFDEEASNTILPMELRRTALYHRGMSATVVDQEIAQGLASGKYRVPRRPAMSYMLSDGQRLISDDGKPAGKWRPHLMIYYPYLTNRDMGFPSAPEMSVGMISDESRPTASVMIIMHDFVPVLPPKP